MRLDVRQWLLDAASAGEEIMAIGAAWDGDRMTGLAIERLLTMAGEALVRIRAADPELLDRITDAYKVIGMRNVLVHAYDRLDQSIVRDVIATKLPVLVLEIRGELGKV